MLTRLKSLRFAAVLLTFCASLSLVGCSGGEKKFGVAGEVTFNGQPIPAGKVYFDPDPTRQGEGTQGFAVIKDGRYDTSKDGKGVGGGAYVVRVEGFDGQGTERSPLGKPLFIPHKQTIDLPDATDAMNISVPASAAEGMDLQSTVDP